MEKNYLVLILLLSINTFAQTVEQNTNKEGYIAEGYDVVAYFNNNAVKGKAKYTIVEKQIKYKFASQENLEKYKLDPHKYRPQYGGWCAYAMGKTGEKVSINPKTFEIRDGKLYLFYNKLFTNTLDSWLKENPEELKEMANKNWNQISKTN